MARPIESTPILKGRDAEKILRETTQIMWTPRLLAYKEKCQNLSRKINQRIAEHRENRR